MNIVVDKGTLDALLPVDADETAEKIVTQMFGETERILKPLGRYLVITLAQDHIVHKFLEFFRNSNRFLIRVHKVDSEKAFAMPVFMFVATKLRSPMPISPVCFLSLNE